MSTSSHHHPENLACSFCGRGQREVHKLVAGPKVFICDNCVGVLLEMVGGTRPKKWKPDLPKSGALCCSFCGRTEQEVWKLVTNAKEAPTKAAVCDECTGLLNDILVEEAKPGS